MRRHTRTPANDSRTPAHSGVTLIEVIVSMLIMSIGVVLLATLLPISILRTAQATQLTQAVFLRNNAEARLKSNPTMLYGTSTPVLPTTPLNPLPTITTALQNYVNGNTTVLYNNNVDGTTYAVIDPLGYYKVVPTPGTNPFWTSPINNAQTGFPIQIPRIYVNQLATTSLAAANLASLPDSWSYDPYILEGPVASVTASSGMLTVASTVTVPTFQSQTAGSNSPLNIYNAYAQNNNLDYPHYRMVIFDSTGKTAVIKPLYYASGQNLYWWDVNSTALPETPLTSGSAFPLTFNATGARVRVEVLQRRFSWLMTVKKQPTGLTTWTANVDVVVFFNRQFTAFDETPYAVTFYAGGTGFDGAPGVRNVDDNGNGLIDFRDPGAELGWRGSDDNRTVVVSGIVPGQTLIKKGGFMFEPYNMAWYRILEIQYQTTTTAVLLLDQDVQYDAEVTVPGQNTGAGNPVNLAGIFMKGVVDVYPLDQINGQN